MCEIVLVGDSIFDNVKYVKPADGEKPVIEHLRNSIPTGWTATLLAVDGNITTDIATQMTKLPSSATHLAMSVGGNDAIQSSGILQQSATSVDAALTTFGVALDEFRDRYRKAMAALLSASKPAMVCTIYDAIPNLTKAKITALALFNDIIIREAAHQGVPILDLRSICDDPTDFSSISSIEPSDSGGAKIAEAIVNMGLRHDFAVPRTTLYV
jgi:hypothetical protein